MSILRQSLFFSIIFAAINISFGQSDSSTVVLKVSKSNIAIHFGATQYRLIDEGISFNKLLFRGILPALHLQYLRNTQRSIFKASFNGNSGKVKTSEGKNASELNNIQLTVAYSRKIADYNLFGLESNFFTGLQLSSIIYYLHSLSLDNLDILTVNGLYISAIQNISINGSSNLEIQAALPTMAFTKRLFLDGGLNKPPSKDATPFKVLFGESRLSFANTFHFNFTYSKNLSRGANFNISYSFNYLTNYSGQPLHVYNNAILLGFKFYFRKKTKQQ